MQILTSLKVKLWQMIRKFMILHTQIVTTKKNRCKKNQKLPDYWNSNSYKTPNYKYNKLKYPINRPGVARAVLQTPSAINPLAPNLQNTITSKQLELATWILTQCSPPDLCNVSSVTCHVSCVTRHLSPVTYHTSFFLLLFFLSFLKKQDTY